MTVKRTLVGFLLAAMLIVIAGAATIWWAFFTEPGTRWLVGRIEARSEPRLSIGSVEGSLWQGFVFNDVRVLIGEDEVVMGRLESRWNVPALLEGLVDLEELIVSQAEYRRASRAPNEPDADEGTLPVALRIRSGSLDRLLIASADGEAAIGPISLALGLEGDRLTFDDVVAEVAEIELRGDGELRLGSEITISAALEWSTEIDGTGFQGRGTIEGGQEALGVRHELLAPVEARTDGEIRLSEFPEADLEIVWNQLAWPGIDVVDIRAGGMRLSGWLDEYEFDGGGQIGVDGIPADFRVAGSGTLFDLAFDSLALTTEVGEVSGSGELAFEGLAWDFDLQARNLDPSVRLVDWPGDVRVSGAFRGRAEPELQWTFAEISLDGVLREQPVSGDGTLSFRSPGIWELDAVNLLVSGNQVMLDGSLGGGIDLAVLVDAPEMAALWPDASGVLRIDGRVGGTFEAPELRGTLEGRALAHGGRSVESLTVTGEVALVEGAPAELELAAAGLAWNNLEVQSLSGRITGSSDSHSVALDIESDFGPGRARAEGAWSQGTWAGRVSSLTVAPPSLGTWELTQPAVVSLGSGVVDLQSTCLRQAGSSVCATARIGTSDDRIEATLTQFDLANLQAFLPEGVSVRGLYDGEVSIDAPLTTPEGVVSISGVSTVVELREGGEAPLEIPVEQFDLNARLTEGALAIEADMRGARDARVSVVANVTDVAGDAAAVSAEVNGRWTDLTMLSLLSPDVGDVSGTVTMEAGIDGPLREPAVKGTARWSGGRVEVPRWGFVVERIEASASSPDGSTVEFTATGVAGGGPVELEGVADLTAESIPMQLSVRGESLQAVRTPDAEVFVSPDLDIQVALPRIEVTGSVLVPRARIVLDEVPAQAVTPSADTIVHRGAATPPPRPLQMLADLEIVLGEEVSYAGQGLEVDLTGELGLVYESGRNAVATGTVNLIGDYQAYGQTLDLDRGQLLFAGPLDNPGLDVRAVRRIETTTVGVQLGGTVRAPTTQIFSSPAMSEADALAYLLFGRPLSGSEDQETATLEGAALSMGLRQALPAIQRVGQTLGLDELTVRTTAADTGELMAGKQISPRVYVRYSYGLFNRIGGLMMRFRLSDRFSLETRSGEYKSMDLMYTVEKE